MLESTSNEATGVLRTETSIRRFSRVEHPIRGVLQVGAIVGIASMLVEVDRRPPDDRLLDGWVRLCLATQLALFAVSTLYHCVPWASVAKWRMQRFDHAMIYVKIAGCVGPVAWLAFDPVDALCLIALAWTIAALGITQKLLVPSIPPRYSSYVQVVQACLLMPAVARLMTQEGSADLSALGLSVICYSAGALVFLLERPRLWPRAFSFHELFHTLIVIGAFAFGADLVERVG